MTPMAQLFMHQRSTEPLHFQMIQLIMHNGTDLDTIIDHIPAQLITQMSLNSKYPCLITTTSLDVSVSDVSPWYCKSCDWVTLSNWWTTKNFRVTKLLAFVRTPKFKRLKRWLDCYLCMEDNFVEVHHDRQKLNSSNPSRWANASNDPGSTIHHLLVA